MSEVTNRNNWIFGHIKSDVLISKEELIKHEVIDMLNKTIRLFKYNNLPETIAEKDFEIQLQVGGYNICKEVNEDLYTFSGGLGGVPNAYYLPTKAVVANPFLKYNATLEIGTECVVTLNDYLYQGMMPTYNKYGALLSEAYMSLRWAVINARIPAMIAADNESSYQSAKEFLDKIIEGKDFGVIASDAFLKGIQTQDFYKDHYIKDVIESIQYIKGSWYNAVGLNAAFNMKRESINEAEAALNEDILRPTIDTMLECRQIGVDKINRMYGTNISVELNGVWETNRKQDDLAIEQIETEIDAIKDEGGDDYENN